MYWTDWGDKPYIGKASMDGTNFRYLVNDSLGWPNALTLSYETNELFYADAKEDYIAVCDLDGKNRRIILNRNTNAEIKLHHVFAITVFEDYIFWTDWELKTVERCKKQGNMDCKTIAELTHRPMDVHVGFKSNVSKNFKIIKLFNFCRCIIRLDNLSRSTIRVITTEIALLCVY